MRIALLWHSANSGNLGVGALTVANLALLERAAADAGVDVEFVIVGWLDSYAPYRQVEHIRALGLSTRTVVSPRGYAGAIRRCDLVVDIGAGDSFADIYGPRRLSFMLATKAIALAVGTPLVLSPQTFGPFRSPVARVLAETLITLSRRAFARDEASIDALHSARARKKVELTTDVAFALPSSPSGRAGRSPVGIGVSALLHNRGYTGENEFGLALDYPAFVQRVIEGFRDRGAEIVLIPHVISPDLEIEDDLALCRALAADHGLTEPPHFHDPVEAKSFIRECDLVVASRMHACIAAVSTGVATVPVAYSRKFAGLFGSLDYPHTIDATTTSTDDAVEQVFALFERREALAAEARAAAAKAEEKLGDYVAAMKMVLEEVASEAACAA